jgi:hypothetical protein
VSGSASSRFEFSPDKSGKKALVIGFTDRYQPGLLAAAFKPRNSRALATFGSLDESYVERAPTAGPTPTRRLLDAFSLVTHRHE